MKEIQPSMFDRHERVQRVSGCLKNVSHFINSLGALIKLLFNEFDGKCRRRAQKDVVRR